MWFAGSKRVLCVLVFVSYLPRGLWPVVRLIDSFVKNSKFARQPDRSDSNPEILARNRRRFQPRKVSADSITNYLPLWMKRWEVLKIASQLVAWSDRYHRRNKKKVVNNGFKDLDPLFRKL